MANATGTATLDFGAAPGSNEATVVVSGQGSILATSKTDAFFMADDTTVSHTAKDHRYADLLISLTCGTPTAATGFTIYATSMQKMTGTFLVRWVWAD